MERKSFYIMRNGEIEHVWQYRIVDHGFNHYLYCRGTETEVREYIESEFPHDKSWHHAMSEDEVEMLGRLGITIYCATQK